MSVSGIYVVVDPLQWRCTVSSLEQLPGVDLHQRDESLGRLVLTQEADSVQSQMDGLSAIQRLPGVRFAELVYHYFQDDGTAADATPVEEGSSYA